jgi:hypothetical protein
LPDSSFETWAGVIPTADDSFAAVMPRCSRQTRSRLSPASSRSTTAMGTVSTSPLE